jgi:hypothetical protein
MAPQTARKVRPAKPAQASLLAVYDGQNCVGTIRVGPRGDAVAHDAKGKRIGSFSSATSAAAALKGSDLVKR